jgi:16S rRNA (guanine966-N2)-methyltransferase
MRMRIISGEFKGRLIKVPDSKFIRPTTDRVRETLFQLLDNRIDFTDLKVLDVYAGSGSLGLELLSRGAGSIHFVEKNFQIYKNLQENIESLGVSEQCIIFKMEALRFTKLSEHEKYDLIIADPPFFKDDIYEVVDNLKSNGFFSKDGRMIIERSIQTRQKDIENLKVEPFKIIGDTCLYDLSI